MSSGCGPPGCGNSGGIGSVLPGVGGVGGGIVMLLSLDKGMPAGRRAFPGALDKVLLVRLLRVGFLARLLVGLLVRLLPILALLLLTLLALALLLVTVLLRLLRVAVLGIVHR
jgi:hypothetical protein